MYFGRGLPYSLLRLHAIKMEMIPTLVIYLWNYRQKTDRVSAKDAGTVTWFKQGLVNFKLVYIPNPNPNKIKIPSSWENFFRHWHFQRRIFNCHKIMSPLFLLFFYFFKGKNCTQKPKVSKIHSRPLRACDVLCITFGGFCVIFIYVLPLMSYHIVVPF